MILLNDLGRHQAANADVISVALERTLKSGWFILGRECKAFEADFAAYCGVSHCVALGNGTDALELALRAVGVTQGSRVATVANAGFYSTAALQMIGAAPVFVDVDESSFLMSVTHLEQALARDDLDALVVTHLYGRLGDMERIMWLAGRAGTPVVEDCAQAHGASRNGRRAGSFGDVAAFSFYPTKNLGALGDAGAVVTRHAAVAQSVQKLRQYGWGSKYCVETLGGRNSRMDELQAAVLRAKLPRLDGWNARRREIAARYTQRLQRSGLSCPEVSGDDYVAHLYVVRTDRRDELREKLASADIATDVHYPVPDTKQRCWPPDREWPRLAVTERLAAEVLSLPCYPELSDEEVQTVISTMLED
jgi:dTDP-3-amino-2,3,6-trideoxy-4-keto-D-glucose/dTDP-3-amino-3,4,6-trideoxy-alpha-D-glucose/dTDP-2,6-dideoxy-D-kanosamine transaminase